MDRLYAALFTTISRMAQLGLWREGYEQDPERVSMHERMGVFACIFSGFYLIPLNRATVEAATAMRTDLHLA